MRIDVKKVLFIGLKEDREPFFKDAQKLGILHFMDALSGKSFTGQEKLHLILDAIKVLRGQPPVEQEDRDDLEHAELIAEEIVKHKHSLEKIEEDLRVSNLEILRIQIYGAFSLQSVKFIEEKTHRVIQFFCAKEGASVPDDLIYIDSEHGLDYYVAISPALLSPEGMVEIKIDRSLEELRQHVRKREVEKRATEEKLQHLARYNHFLHKASVAELNVVNLKHAENSATAALDSALFAVTAWVPEDKLGSLSALTDQFSVHVEEVSIDPLDAVPTYLENENLGRIGQDVIGVYDIPSTGDKDPSKWVLFGFLLFFSIIIGDAGYGMIFLVLALYLRYKFPNLRNLKKRMLDFFTILSIGCITWGVLSSTFFGLSPDPDHPIKKLSLLAYVAEKKAEYHKAHNTEVYQGWIKKYPEVQSANNGKEIVLKGYEQKEGVKNYSLLKKLNDEVLLEMALFIGAIHISLGMLRYIRINWVNFGWFTFILGAYLYFPVYLGAPSVLNYLFGVPFEKGGEAGFHLIFIGIGLAVFLGIVKYGILGIFEITVVIQVFADVLSYLRIYALGLSGSILSETVNDMSTLLPFVIAFPLILMGHSVNMILGVMGGVIHGLRLNFLEWYHYSFEGGGKKFKPLELKEIE